MAWRQALPRLAAATTAPAASLALCEAQRKTDYDLARHQHGKTRVRVLKVRREGGVHAISEYKVETTLFSPAYDRVFTKGDNTDLVATDTQKNTVYIVAKRTDASTPEAFGVALCEHLLKEYPILSGCRADVESVEWARACVDGRNGAQPHVHGFLRSEPERQVASVSMTRGQGPKVESSIEGLVVLKTTQSGFEGYLKDKYTLLPDTQERCMATEMTASWNYAQLPQDFGAARNNVRRQILKGFFGEPATGVYSASLQESIYDAGCLVLDAVPEVSQIEIDTPNLHYLPAKLLDAVGEKFEDDVFIPTSEPSGSINCIVARGAGGRPTTTAPTSGPKLSVETKPVSLNVADAQARAAEAIRGAIITPKANSCPMAVRLAWHASGTYDKNDGSGGSDGATMRFAPEREDGANAGLGIERDILQPVKRAVPEASTADIWTLAGAQAVEVCGGPKINHAMGRRDAASGAECPPTGRLPDASQGADHLRDVFYRMGFDDREIVALSGAHTLGRCHKVRSGFDGPWTSNPLKFDGEYFRNLMTKDWVPRDWDGPLQYTDAESHSLTMLPSDLALKEDPAFAVYASKYAADESLFFEDFKKAFEKLISLGTATAPASTDLDDAAAKVREECMHGSLEHAQTAWRPGVDANSYDAGSRRTALHKAAFWGHSHIVPWLVDDLGAAVDATDSAGDTALHDAARFGHANVVSELLARGASPTARNAAGKTPGEVAAENGHASALRRFLEK
jgi:urate oxidase